MRLRALLFDIIPLRPLSTRKPVLLPLAALGASFLCSGLFAGQPSKAASPLIAGQSVSASDARIRYIGRFDTRDPAGPRCEWPASAVELRFTGHDLIAKINDTGDGDAYEVTVDDAKPTILTLQKGTAFYPLLSETSVEKEHQEHTLTLVKRTEAFVGTTQFLDFILLPNEKLLAPPAPAKHRLEIIGDSITCGYGDEAAGKDEHFTPATENADAAYGALAAHALGADYTAIAWSGRTMWPDNTTPSIYGLTLPTDPTSVWDTRKIVPDAIVINLATNDFGKENPDRDGWTTAYEQFITRLRGYYPKAEIYVASGPMMSDSYPAGHMALTTLYSYLTQIQQDEQKQGDKNVRLLVFDPQTPENGYGADWHPSLKTHAVMAAKLEAALTADLGWTPQR